MNVTIVGAGIIGHAIAYELATRDAAVCLVDPRGSGQGATRASAGILAPHIEGHSPELLRLAQCSLDQYDLFIDRLTRDAQRSVEYRRHGTLQVARTEDEVRGLKEAAKILDQRGRSYAFVDGDEARRLEPALSESVGAGLLVPENGYVGVASLIAALEQACQRRGVRVVTARVERIEGADPVRVHAGPNVIDSEVVVVAAGSWSAGIPMASATAIPVRPIRGQLVHLRFAREPVTRVIWGSSAYLVPWTDGSVLVGATVEDAGFDERLTAAGVHQLLEAAAGLLPSAAHATFVEGRVGLRPATADELPIVGRSSTMRGVYYATGHYRNGVLLAPLTASLVADLVLESRERPELALMRPGRFGL